MAFRNAVEAWMDGTTVGPADFDAGAVGLTAIAPNAIDGTIAANVGSQGAVPGLELILRVDVAAGATGNVDTTLTYKVRIFDVSLIKNGNAGGGARTIQVKNGANAITDAMSINVNASTVVRAATIDSSQWEIAAGGTLRVTRTRTASPDEGCTV